MFSVEALLVNFVLFAARRSMIASDAAPSSAAPFHLDCDRWRPDWRALRRCPSWNARHRGRYYEPCIEERALLFIGALLDCDRGASAF
jgi:hypothetical protein